jgi:hypothetical protein
MACPIDRLQWSAEKFAKGLIGKKDRTLSDKLSKRRTDFLRWLVLGAMKFYTNNMNIQAPDKINQCTLKYIAKAQTLRNYMSENYMTAKDNVSNRIPLRWIYGNYIEYTGRQRTIYNAIRFRKDLEHLGHKIKKMKYLWEGYEKGAQLCILAIKRIEVDDISNADMTSQCPDKPSQCSDRTSPWKR